MNHLPKYATRFDMLRRVAQNVEQDIEADPSDETRLLLDILKQGALTAVHPSVWTQELANRHPEYQEHRVGDVSLMVKIGM